MRDLNSRRCAAVTLAVSFTAIACAPTIDLAAKEDIDGRVAALRPGSESYAAPTAPEPLPPRVGQWTMHKVMDDKAQPSFVTYKVVGEEGSAFWVEIVNDGYTGKTIQKMLIDFGDRKSPSTMHVKAMVMKDKDGKVTEVDAKMLGLMHSMWDSMLSTLVVNWTGLPHEDVTVPAGAFNACYKGRSDASWGPWKSSAQNWSHTSVPLSGLVRAKGIDKPFSMELVGFGESGAATEMP